jgi:DNA-binding IclR family transcriptional regulator
VSSVQSIRRAFDVLGSLAGGPLGVTEVADRAGLPKSTAARLLATLAREGAVEQVPGDTAYRLGPRLVTLAAGFSLARSLAALARPTLEGLARETQEAAGLGIADGDLVHYVDQVDTPNQVVVRDWTGSRAPLHAVSSGQVLLSFRTPSAIERYLEGPLERFTPRTPADADAVRARIREVRQRGYAWAIEEFDVGLSSVAAPIADGSGEVIAAVHVHGPSYRFPPAGRELEIAQLVVAAGARIAGALRDI